MVSESLPQTNYSELRSWTLWTCAPSAHSKTVFHLRSAPRCTLTKCLWSSAAASGIVRVALSAPFSSFCVLVEQMLFTAVKSCALPMSLHTYFPVIFIKLREILKIKKTADEQIAGVSDVEVLQHDAL